MTWRFIWASALSSNPLWAYWLCGFSGASFSSQVSKSPCSPDSSSLMNTEAVICIALQSSSPSRIPDSFSAASTCGVMLTNCRRCGNVSVSSLRKDFIILFSCRMGARNPVRNGSNVPRISHEVKCKTGCNPGFSAVFYGSFKPTGNHL